MKVDNDKEKESSDSVIKVSKLRLCIKKLKFKTYSEDPDEKAKHIDFPVGEVLVNPEGTDLGITDIPEGFYQRVEIEMDDKEVEE